VISASVPTGGIAACWVAVSPNGRWAFDSNAHGGTISSFEVHSNGSISLELSVAATPARAAPRSICRSARTAEIPVRQRSRRSHDRRLSDRCGRNSRGRSGAPVLCRPAPAGSPFPDTSTRDGGPGGATRLPALPHGGTKWTRTPTIRHDRPKQPPILVVDDDAKIVRLVRTYLEREGFRVVEASDGRSALAAIALDPPTSRRARPDAARSRRTIDHSSRATDRSDTDRHAFGSRLDGRPDRRSDRRRGRLPAQAVLAGRTGRQDQACPRIERASGRATPPAQVLGTATWFWTSTDTSASVAGKPVELTALEFRLLAALIEADGRVLTREQLMDAVYGDGEAFVLDRTIDAMVKRLREKLSDDAERPRYMATVRGVGLSGRAPGRRGGWHETAYPAGIGSRIAAGRRPRVGARRRDRRGRDPRVGRPLLRPPHDRRRPLGRFRSGDVRRLGRPRRRPWLWSWRSSRGGSLGVLGYRIARPLREVAGRRAGLPRGDYAARVPRRGPRGACQPGRLVQPMAASLQEQERLRREFIANAAHELRTPLTNLQGYLEALARRGDPGRPRHVRVALGRGRAARPAVALARRAGRGRFDRAPVP
jgi:DNA-binding response OmpR family regulator